MNGLRETVSTAGFVDIHSHFVYGLDDGAQNLQEMYAMLDAAHEDGISMLYATPHVMPGYKPFSLSLYQERFDQAIAYCRNQQYKLKLFPGAELLYTPSMQRYIEEQRLITMGNSEHILVEFSPKVSYSEMADAIASMERSGYIPILAHAERYGCLLGGRALLKLKEHYDVRCQINANTLLTKQGILRRLIIDGWLKEELVDYVASDAHNTTSRPFRMKQVNRILKQRLSSEYATRVLSTGLSE